MKKLLLIFATGLFVFNANAQDAASSEGGGFIAGVSVGLPVGDAGDGYSFNITLELNFLWQVSDSFDAGLATGYSHNILDSDFEGDDASFIPIAGAARFNISDDFTLGADIGYAIGISPDGNDGGFYYAPRLQYGVSDSIDIVAAYRGVSVDGGSFDVITLGVQFEL